MRVILHESGGVVGKFLLPSQVGTRIDIFLYQGDVFSYEYESLSLTEKGREYHYQRVIACDLSGMVALGSATKLK